jgi:hypothetical protein
MNPRGLHDKGGGLLPSHGKLRLLDTQDLLLCCLKLGVGQNT